MSLCLCGIFIVRQRRISLWLKIPKQELGFASWLTADLADRLKINPPNPRFIEIIGGQSNGLPGETVKHDQGDQDIEKADQMVKSYTVIEIGIIRPEKFLGKAGDPIEQPV